MTAAREEGGFTLIEVLIAIFLFSVLSVGFYQVMFSGVRGSDTTRYVADTTDEARRGFNRMVRDTREADNLMSATSTSYSIFVDYNGSGLPPEPGLYELLRFSFDGATGRITLSALNSDNSVWQSDVLMAGVGPVGSAPIFSYSSNLLQYDTNNDGVTDESEIDAAPGIGNGDGAINGPELELVSSVKYSVTTTSGDRSSSFSTEAQIRNRRYRQ